MSIYDVVGKTPEQLEEEVKKAEEEKAEEKRENGRRFEEPVYTGINLDVDTLTRNTKRYYVYGSGREELPEEIAAKVTGYVQRLWNKDYVLRVNPEDRQNSLAKKAYIAASAPREVNGEIVTGTEVFLPWQAMNKAIPSLVKKPTELAHRTAIWIAKQVYKSDEEKYNNRESYFKAFDATLVHLLLGKSCTEPVDFMIIYTKDGYTELPKGVDFKDLDFQHSKLMQIAKLFDIKIYNLGNNDSIMELEQFLGSVVEA